MKINVTPKHIESLLESLGRITAGKLILEDELTEEEVKAVSDLFQSWVVDEPVQIGYLRKFNGELYKCVQAHTTQADWTPDVTPALWTIKSAPGIIPAWVQPTGAQDAYNIDDMVTHVGKTWRSTIDANTTVPGENPAFNYWIEVV